MSRPGGVERESGLEVAMPDEPPVVTRGVAMAFLRLIRRVEARRASGALVVVAEGRDDHESERNAA
jgi:hypothetical protein